MSTETKKPGRTLLEAAQDKKRKADAKVQALQLRETVKSAPKVVAAAYKQSLEERSVLPLRKALAEYSKNYEALFDSECPEPAPLDLSAPDEAL